MKKPYQAPAQQDESAYAAEGRSGECLHVDDPDLIADRCAGALDGARRELDRSMCPENDG